MNSRTPHHLALTAAILLAFTAPLAAQSAQSTPTSIPTPSPQTTFLSRLVDFYRTDWAGKPPTPPDAPAPDIAAPTTPTRRGIPSPLDSPPFPNSDWSYGGAPVLGEPDGQTYPLMSAATRSPTRTKVYGWFEPTLNVSTSSHSNFPEANDATANRLELNQFVLYVERLPDTVQQKHFDYGFHLTALLGTDYRFTTGKGYFSSQLLKHNNPYGFDPALEYVDLYFPVAQGLNLRIGRFISVPGIEAQLAPNNYTFSHSLLYAIDPFTDTGVLATIKLSNRWLLQGGLTASHDVAPWVSDAKPSATACLDFTTATGLNNVYLCANGINSGRYAYNNLQQYDVTWYHKFSKSFHSATEVWLMYERGVPSTNGPITPEQGANGAACHPGLERCLAPEYAAVNFTQWMHSEKDFFALRTDFLNDKKAQRTGFQTRYSEETLSWTRWFGTTVQLRPELRFDHAWDRRSYNNGLARNQLTVASDLIVHF